MTDEPTAYCDIVAKKLIWEEIEYIRSRGLVMFSTNDLNEAEKLIKPNNGKIGLIKNGQIVFSGSLLDLQSQLANTGNLNLVMESQIDSDTLNSFKNLLCEQFDELAINTVPTQNAINIGNINQENMNEIITEAIVYFQSQNIYLDKIEKVKPSINDLFIHNEG